MSNTVRNNKTDKKQYKERGFYKYYGYGCHYIVTYILWQKNSFNDYDKKKTIKSTFI